MSTRPPRIFIDATDCSVKAEVYRLAARHGMRVALVSESDLGAPFEPWLTKVVTGPGAVAATILAEASARDIIITENADLASQMLEKNIRTLNSRGQRYTPDGLFPPLRDKSRGNYRARFLSVLEDEITGLLSGL
jgi:uncharacterized protein YaiI (UPF0178 family)